ncbi:MAG: PKD domain-containing protein [Desulfovibrio sp.]
MSSIRIFILSLLLVSFSLGTAAYAAGPTSNWLYGRSIMTFEDNGSTTTTPVPTVPLSYSSYSLSADNGSLLFFGTGSRVYKHQEDGTNLLISNNLSAATNVSQAAVFFPVRDSSEVELLHVPATGSMRHSRLDYNGAKSSDIWTFANATIPDTNRSKAITVVDHANKRDTWIVSMLHTEDAGKGFEVLLYDGSTFTKKNVSVPSANANGIGQFSNFMFSPKGQTLVFSYLVGGQMGFAQYSFDTSTGELTFVRNYDVAAAAGGLSAGGLAFSGDGHYLYIGGGSATSTDIYQLDMTEADPTPVKMAVDRNTVLGGAQLAPNGNIYYCVANFVGELHISNADKAYTGGADGAQVITSLDTDIGSQRPGLPLFNQSLLFADAMKIERSYADLKLAIEASRLPVGTLSAYGICWTDANRMPLITDSILSATDVAAPPTWDMSGRLTPGTDYTIRAFATVDGTTTYYDLLKLNLAVPPSVDVSASDTNVAAGDTANLRVVPVAGCTYLWEQVNGTAVTLADPTAVNTTFVMPTGKVGMRVVVRKTDGTSASGAVVVSSGPEAVIETASDVSNAGGVDLVAQAQAGATYLWEQTGGPSVTITNSTSREAHFDATGVANGTALTFKLTVTDANGTTVTTKVITVRTPPSVVFVGIPSKAKAGVAVGLVVQPVAGATYAWTKTAGVAVVINNANTANANFSMPATAGTMTFKATITDAHGIASSKTVSVKRDVPPVAAAGPDQNATEGSTITLSGDDSSDAMGEALTYAWTQISGTAVTLTGSTNSNCTFVAPVVPLAGEALGFRLTVRDPDGQTDTDDVTVNVAFLNDAPIADAGPNQQIEVGGLVTLKGDNSYDSDVEAITYKWTQTDGNSTVTLSDDTAANPTFTAPATPGSLRFNLTVKDTAGLEGNDDVVCNVVPVGSGKVAPIAAAGPDCTVALGAKVSLNGFNSHALGADNYLTSYSWRRVSGPAVTIGSTSSARTSFTAPNTAAELVFELTVKDKNGLSATDKLIVNVTGAGNPPVANAGNDQTVSSGAVGVALDASGSSAPGSSISSYLWRQTSGLAVTLSNTRVSNPTFTAPVLGAGAEALTFRLTVSNAAGLTDSDNIIVNVDGGGALLMPTAVAGNDVNATGRSVEGLTVTLNGNASTPNGGATLSSYSWKQVCGPNAPLADPSAIETTLVCPATDIAATLVYELTVTDSNNMESTARTSIVYDPNAFPDIDDTQIEFVAYDGVQHLGISPKDPIGGSTATSGEIVALSPVDPDNTNATGTTPTDMTLGLINFKVRVEKPGDSTEIVVELPSAAAGWVKLNDSGEWTNYEHVVFSADRKTVTITLTDGGDGDDDGLANGIICDPSGPGVLGGSGIAGVGGGCTMVPRSSAGVDMLLLLLGGVGLALYRGRRQFRN